MVIDIVEYTDEQYAAMAKVKLTRICNAQLQKNRLRAKLERALAKERRRLVDRGIFYADIWERREAELREEVNAEIARIREALLFYLENVVDGGDLTVPSDVPYPVDFSLSEEERTLVVKQYYLDAYADPNERLEAYMADEFSQAYVGKYAESLRIFFLDWTR